MIRRSFRLGLWLGLLFGIGAALYKVVQGRRTPAAPKFADYRPPPRPATQPRPAATDPIIPQPEPEPVKPEPVPEPTPIVPDPGPIVPEPQPIVPEPEPTPLVPDPSPEPAPPSPTATKKSAAAKRAPAAKKAAAKKTTPVAQTAPATKAPAKSAKKVAKARIKPWVNSDGGVCPASHPVKAKMASRIFHVPGGFNYTRTSADRCYLSPEAAESDGLRAARR